MSTKTPIFPMPEPQHFSDYGFDPQIDYFQVLEEARNHKRETSSLSLRSIDSLQKPIFKLRKPITKDEFRSHKKKQWWRNALLFFKRKWVAPTHHHNRRREEDVHDARARAFRASVSGPVYITESRSGSSTPCRSRRESGPLAGTLTPRRRGELEVPYLSLRELNMEQLQQQRVSTSATMPIYLVT